jgi:hypothetical protein
MLAAVKYWVYKDSRILGPFDKNDVAGLPGLDASTLVCAGDSAAAGEGDWRPAGDVAEFAALPLHRGWSFDGPPSTFGVLDKLQLDSAGLIGDDEFPGAAEDLFQDAEMKRTFGDMLAPRPSVDAAELRRAKNRTAELTVQLELLYRRVAELEAGQAGLTHRLSEKEEELRSRPEPPPAPAPVVPPPAPKAAPPPGAPPRPAPLERPGAAEFAVQFEQLRKRMAELEAGHLDLAQRVASAPAPVPDPAAATPSATTLVPTPIPAPVPASAPVVLTPAPAPSAAPAPEPVSAPAAPTDWPSVPTNGEAFPSFPSLVSPAPAPSPAPLPTIPALAPMASPVLDAPAEETIVSPAAAASPAPTPAAEPPPTETSVRKTLFERKTFKIVPTVKAFRIVGEEQPSAAAPSEREAIAAPSATAPAAAPVVNAFDWGSATPVVPTPVLPPAPVPMPAPTLAPPPPVPEMASTPVPAEAPAPTPMPAVVPPATFSFGVAAQPEPANSPMPTFSAQPSFIGGTAQERPAMPAFTPAFNSMDDMAGAPSSEAALARLAKPEAPPPTAAPRAPRSNKLFLIGAGALVIVMAGVGALFLRHPKDLKQMTDLDDGRARVGAEPTDDASRPPLVKPKPAEPPADVSGAAPADASRMAAPAPAAAAAGSPPVVEAPQAASQAKLDAAVSAVKDFPLDGERGTVAQWLQFSYSASPDAGKESWSASETADKTYLVEYRFTPSARGDEVHYLFEVDMDRGFVIGKNIDAKSVLAGGPRAVAENAKPKAKPRKPASRAKKAAKRPVKRPAADAAPKDVPLLPLPSEGELRPPAEDDGAFNSDTVDSAH